MFRMMKNLRYILPILLNVLFIVSLQAQTRRALVIGLGEQEDKSWAKINGDKDVPYVKEMLIKSGYKDIVTLVNRQATKAGIVSAFTALADQCKSGDRVYIHFSGHGQLVTDVDGDEKSDSLDEAWIPYDAYLKYGEKDRGEKHLTDDDINEFLTKIKNKIGDEGKMLVVVDACHSGDSSRGGEETENLSGLDETIRGVRNVFMIPVKERGNVARLEENWLTLSACKDYQFNQEMKVPQVGKLTYALYTASLKGNVTMEGIKVFMAKHRGILPQTPVLSGKTDKYTISDFISIEP